MNERRDNDSSEATASERLEGRNAVREYIRLHHRGANGAVYLLYISDALEVLDVKRSQAGGSPEISRNLLQVIRRGQEVGAAGFIIAQVHPGERYHPDRATLVATNVLRRDSAELELPLLDHLVLTDTQMIAIGGP